MIEASQNLALPAESFLQRFGEQAGANHLDRDPLAKRSVDARGFVHGPHAAAPDLADDFVGADAGSGEIGFGILGERRGMKIRNGLVQEFVGTVVRGEQLFDFRHQGWIRLAGPQPGCGGDPPAEVSTTDSNTARIWRRRSAVIRPPELRAGSS